MTLFAKSGIAIAAAVLASSALADVSFNANMEIDPTYFSSRDRAENGKKEGTTTNLGGRVEINALAALAKNGDNFVNAKATLIVPVSGESKVSVDDAWIQLGNSTIDLKLGRQEAADLFPLGKDTVFAGANDAIGGYRANALRGRVDSNRLHSVLGINAGAGLRAEIGFMPETDDSSDKDQPAYGVRPTLVYTAGAATVRLGYESAKVKGGESQAGVGVSLGYALNSSSNLNVNYADSSDRDASSVGVNLTLGDAGIGYVQDTSGDAKQNTVYVAYTMSLLGVKGASLTPAISHSSADGVDDLTAIRLRMNYAF